MPAVQPNDYTLKGGNITFTYVKSISSASRSFPTMTAPEPKTFLAAPCASPMSASGLW